MFKKVRGLILVAAVMFGGITLAVPAVVSAAPKDEICKGVGIAGGGSGCTDSGELEGVVAKVVNIISLVVGIIAVIMVLVGGIKYVTSSGDSNNINSAKNTILYAIVGLIVAALAQVIVRFVLDKAT